VKIKSNMPWDRKTFAVGDLIRVRDAFLSFPVKTEEILDIEAKSIQAGAYLIVDEFKSASGVIYYKLIKPNGMIMTAPKSAEWCWEIVP